LELSAKHKYAETDAPHLRLTPKPAPHRCIGGAVVDHRSFVILTTYRRQSGAAPGTKWIWKSASSGLRCRGQTKVPFSGVFAIAVSMAVRALV
jgi:hypothetical protein